MPSIGLVANIYNEVNALPGWLETHLPIFDDVRILHAGPQGKHSDDGTMELLEKWRIPVHFTAIDEGFGAIRTEAIRMSPCDWVMILDADERFHGLLLTMTCSGESDTQAQIDQILQSYDFSGVNLPNWENVGRLGEKLQVRHDLPLYDQMDRLRALISGPFDALITKRRHWHDLTMKRPTQDWNVHPDWQLRLVKNLPEVHYTNRMHEQLQGAKNVLRCSSLFFDHYHFTFKRMEQKQRAHDIRIYNAINDGKAPPCT